MQRSKKLPKRNSYGQSLLTVPVPHIPEKESFRAYASELEKTIHIVLQTIDFHGLNVGLVQLCNEYAKKNHNHTFHAINVIISRIDRQLQNKLTWCRSVHLKKLQHENAFTVHFSCNTSANLSLLTPNCTQSFYYLHLFVFVILLLLSHIANLDCVYYTL